MKKLKIIFLLSLVLLFTSCTSLIYKDGYYSGKEPIKQNFGIIVASATADKYYGPALVAYLSLENIETNEKIDLQNAICKVKKDSPGIGPLAKVIMGDKPIEDQIVLETKCGSLLVGEIKTGRYELKYIRLVSNDIAQGGFVSSLRYTPSKKEIIDIKDGEIVYLGRINLESLNMNKGFQIRSVSISMSDEYNLDAKVFQEEYNLLKNSEIKNNSLQLKKQNFK